MNNITEQKNQLEYGLIDNPFNLPKKEDTKKIREMKPKHQHDCADCVYLGSMKMDTPGYEGNYDFYYCNNLGKFPTIIAHYGDNYLSGLVFGKNHYENGLVTPFSIAYLLAMSKGLIEE